MANVQLLRQRNVQTNAYTTTRVDQAQSLELVQTMLHGALSTLTYLRGLFPTKAFESCYYRLRDAPLSYADFAAGRMPTKKDEADDLSTKIPVLLRERSRRVDRFLDWLASNSNSTHASASLLTLHRSTGLSKDSSPENSVLSRSLCTP